jgi:hypothetical protein
VDWKEPLGLDGRLGTRDMTTTVHLRSGVHSAPDRSVSKRVLDFHVWKGG